MRLLGLVLLGLGIVVCATGSFAGCQRLFAWNGRHPVASVPLTSEEPATIALRTQPRARYTAAVQVVFEREGLAEKDGALVVRAQLPVTGALRDDAGRSVLQMAGWLDPSEPPSVLYGQAHGAETHHVRGQEPPELMVERLMGPWPSGDGAQDISFEMILGRDRIGEANISATRLVVYDDVLPTSIKIGFGLAALGAVAAVVGAAILSLVGIRKLLSRRGGNPRRQRL